MKINKQNIINKTYIIQTFLMALIYFISGRISFLLSPENSIVTIVIFTAEGFALAGILIYGKKMWLGILLGQLCLAFSMNVDFFPSLLIGTINSIEALLGFYLFRYFKLNTRLMTLKDVFGLSLIIIFALQTFSSIFGIYILSQFDVIAETNYMESLFSWWFGNIVGQLLLTPFLLSLYHGYNKIKIGEFVAVSIFFLLLSYASIIHYHLPYLSLLLITTAPLLIYISSKRELYYPIFLIIIIAFIAIHSTHLNIGFFSSSDLLNNLISFNFYILFHIFLILLVSTLFSEKNEALKKLKSMAFYDNLTGLPNRYLLDEKIQDAILCSKKHNKQSAICFIDVDGFKSVNDNLGHNIGDETLKIVGKNIREKIGINDSLLRVGGDEFVLILKNTDKEMISQVLENISSTINKPFTISNHTIKISLSIGIALSPKDAISMTKLIHYADKSMYKAKERGKNQFVFYGE